MGNASMMKVQTWLAPPNYSISRRRRDDSPVANGSAAEMPLYNLAIARAAFGLRVPRIVKEFMTSEFEQDGVRIDVLRRLAEQAMSDLEFRSVARDDLNAALTQYGYDLNPNEMSLVLKFRAVLEEAGLDLFLTGDLKDREDDLLTLAGMLGKKSTE